jgi:hypothetical protein
MQSETLSVILFTIAVTLGVIYMLLPEWLARFIF